MLANGAQAAGGEETPTLWAWRLGFKSRLCRFQAVSLGQGLLGLSFHICVTGIIRVRGLLVPSNGGGLAPEECEPFILTATVTVTGTACPSKMNLRTSLLPPSPDWDGLPWGCAWPSTQAQGVLMRQSLA